MRDVPRDEIKRKIDEAVARGIQKTIKNIQYGVLFDQDLNTEILNSAKKEGYICLNLTALETRNTEDSL